MAKINQYEEKDTFLQIWNSHNFDLEQAATGVYDSLLRDIERAQAELSSINTALANTGLYQVFFRKRWKHYS